MPLPLKIALRYLFAKKSHSAINLISLVSVLGVAVTTMAIICTLSVYNGFQGLVATLCSQLDPQVKIAPVSGKTLDTSAPEIAAIYHWNDIAAIAPVIEENALAVFGKNQMPIFLKGVSPEYTDVHPTIDDILYTGEFHLSDTTEYRLALGIGVASHLETGALFSRPVRIFAPKRKARVNLANPSTSFREEQVRPSAIFLVNQQEYDETWVLAPLALVRQLYDYTIEASALELRLTDTADERAVIKRLQQHLGPAYRVQNRLQQQSAAFSMMQIEKWITFLILLFILMIATFNVIGSLSMLIIDKKEDILTLRNLGADDTLISRIFLTEGWLISAFGAGGGLTAGIILCRLQEAFGLLRMGGTSGAFIIDAYPVHLLWSDALVVLIVVVLIGFIASWYPVKSLRHRLLSRDEE
ncbi:MAG: ABC transporter permease [Coprobacter sp.]|nr:ABC transporter permease [Coprobacter sp.]